MTSKTGRMYVLGIIKSRVIKYQVINYLENYVAYINKLTGK